MGLILTFGEPSGLAGRVVRKTPWGYSQILAHDDERAKLILIYEKEHVIYRSGASIAGIRERLKPGDFVRFFSPAQPKTMYPVKKIITPERYKNEEDSPQSSQRAHILLESRDHPDPIETCSLGHAVPGPKSEPHLYKGAKVTIDPAGQVSLDYPKAGAWLLLRTREYDEEHREEDPNFYKHEFIRALDIRDIED